MTDHHFISYSTKDALEFALKLCDELAAGQPSFPAWLDQRQLKPGSDWQDQVLVALQTCESLIFVMSRDSVRVGSECKNEWSRALKYKKPVIPVLFHADAEPPLRLSSRQYINFDGGIGQAFESGMAKLRKHLDWLSSPEGRLQVLKDRLADAERDARFETDSLKLERIRDDIDAMQKEIQNQEFIIKNPGKAAARVEESISRGLERELHPEKPVGGSAPTKFINFPPGAVPLYFQNRYLELETMGKFLQNDAERLLIVTGRAGIGKTAMVCRLLKALENGQLPNDHGPLPVDGIVYLGENGVRKVNFPNLYADLCLLLPTELSERLKGLYKDPQIKTADKMRELLAAFSIGRVVVLLDYFETKLESGTLEIADAELEEALKTLLECQQHGVKIIITTRVYPRTLGMTQPGRQFRLDLDKGLDTPYAENILREIDKDGKAELKTADEELLRQARERTLGNPRALEALYAILASDRETSLRDILADTEKRLPEEVVEKLVGEAYNRLDFPAQKVLQALAIYGRGVTTAAVDYLLQPFQPGVDSAPILNRLLNIHLVRRENKKYYLHPVDAEYVLSRVPEGEASGRKSKRPRYTRVGMLRRGAEYFKQARLPRQEWKTIDHLAPQLAEIELRSAAGDIETALQVLLDIDYEYLLLWGHYRLTAQLHEVFQGKSSEPKLKESSTGRLGIVYRRMGQFEKAVTCHEQALKSARKKKDLWSQSVYLGDLAGDYGEMGQAYRAIEYYEQAIRIHREIGNRQGEAVTLGNLGICYADLGQKESAIEYYKQALRIHQEIGDRQGEAVTLGNLGICYAGLGQKESAIEYYKQALRIHQEIGNRQGEAVTLGNLGICYADLGQKESAIEYYKQALRIHRDIGNRQGEAVTLGNLGIYYADLGLKDRAIKYYEQALAIWNELYGEQHPDIARSLNNIGVVWKDLSKPQKAIEYIKKALDIDEKIYGKEHPAVARDLKNLGEIYLSLGQNDVSRPLLERAASIFIHFFGEENPEPESVKYWLQRTLTKIEKSETAFDSDLNAKSLENELRTAVDKGNYPEGKKILERLIRYSPSVKDSFQQEFGFVYDIENPHEDERKWEQMEGQIAWRRKVWRTLAARNNFKLIIPEANKDQEGANGEKSKKPENGTKDHSTEKGPAEEPSDDNIGKIHSEEKGELLEKAVLDLFKYFFEICEKGNEFTIINARQQASGTQSGHDLKFVCEVKGSMKLRFLIECKNLSRIVTTDDIAGKLLDAQKYHRNVPIDHWILVSPNANVANILEEHLELWEEEGEFPFKVQAWTPATGVKEFFGLIPKWYDSIITVCDLKIHPGEWKEEYKNKVLEDLKEKLLPPLRLPKGWGEYLRKPEKFRRQDEPLQLEDLYNNKSYVTMNCKDETGAFIHGKTLEDKVNEWLEKTVKEHPSLILMGDFGDGKTTFSYILSRKLAEQFLKSPSTGWLLVRFFLKDFSIKNVSNSKDFLCRRLEQIGADMDGWDTLAKSNYKLLVIFDGFDEMSKKMDHKTIMENIKKIVECFRNEFSGMKVLITSRKHFFENQIHKNTLLQRIGNPQLLILAPIKRKDTENHLKEYAKGIGQEKKFEILTNRHDPIGLASKPLYLEMVKSSLQKLPDTDLDELILYETYIDQSLERKGDFLEDENLETSPEDIINNMKEILENVSVKLHQSVDEFVYLSDIQGSQKIINLLWDMSDPTDCIPDDLMSRIAVRSLLKRVEPVNTQEGKQWPVDFCHRSLREYYIARAICKMLGKYLEQAKVFLQSCDLGYEIIFFASKMMMKSKGIDFTEPLWKLIQETKCHDKKTNGNTGHLGRNAANLLYQYKGTIPNFNWSHLVLDLVDFSGADLSGRDFSYTSFRNANLDNVNFTNANFTGCDLTGVRLEEASSVRAVAFSSEENIYALYDDGVIREWKYNRIRAPYPINLGKIEIANDIRLIAQPGNDLTLVADNRIIFYDKETEKITQRAAFEIKPTLKPANAFHDSIMLIEEKDDRYSLRLINLEDQSTLQSVSVAAFTLCAHLGNAAFIVYDQEDGLQLVRTGVEESKMIINPKFAKITCLTTFPLDDTNSQWRIAFGQENGSVTIINIDLSTWETKEVLRYSKHEQAVRYIMFIDDKRIVSGGIDRKILLTHINPNETIEDTAIPFKLQLQCKGMKTDGIKPDEKKEFLEKLIADAEGRDE